MGKEKGKLAAYAIKRVAVGAHLLTPWFFEPAKSPDDRADSLPGLQFEVFPSANTKYSFLRLSGEGRALWANNSEGSAQ